MRRLLYVMVGLIDYAVSRNREATQPVLSARDKAVLDAAQVVIDAWTIPGRVPNYHIHKVHQLRSEWPALAKAVERLAYEDRRHSR